MLKVTEMGNVLEVQYMSNRNCKQTIQMLPGMKQYIEVSSGEVKNVTKHDTRVTLNKNLQRTFKTLRGIINTNITDVSKVRWITLTYKENMTDTVRLYKDFEKFNKRFQTYCKNNNYGKAEYIAMMEPQGRGAWHCHLLYIFNNLVKAPYIANKTLSGLWGHGFVKISKLDNVDNVGAYLTAYLGDMDLQDCLHDEIVGNELKEVVIEENGRKESKYYVKGARLKYYPAKFNMFRCSRGVKRPLEVYMTQEEAEKKVSGAKLTFEKTVKLHDEENDFETIINTRYYNRIRIDIQ
jgi:hypothetical protein